MAPRSRRWTAAPLLLALLVGLPGCGLFVAAGRMIWGDPVMPSYFKESTGVDLDEIDGSVLVYCSAPEAIKGELASLELDLAEDAGREMRRKGINVIRGREVAEYLEESGGLWGDEDELAAYFDDARVIVHFDLGRFDYMEENSPNLFRGRVSGMLRGYEVVQPKEEDGRPTTRLVFEREFNSTYPNHVPISVDRMSKRVFQQQLKERIGLQLAQVFADYRVSELQQ